MSRVIFISDVVSREEAVSSLGWGTTAIHPNATWVRSDDNTELTWDQPGVDTYHAVGRRLDFDRPFNDNHYTAWDRVTRATEARMLAEGGWNDPDLWD